MAATVLFTDGNGRFLICEPAYKQVLECPGGAVEDDEPPYTAAVREVEEELGLTVEPGRLLAVDYVSATPEGRTEGVVYVFAGGRLTGEQVDAIVLDPSELRSWFWTTVAEARGRMRPLVARRIEASLAAIASGETVYLENGYSIIERSRY